MNWKRRERKRLWDILKITRLYLSDGTEKNHKKRKWEEPVCRSWIEPRTFQISSSGDGGGGGHQSATFGNGIVKNNCDVGAFEELRHALKPVCSRCHPTYPHPVSCMPYRHCMHRESWWPKTFVSVRILFSLFMPTTSMERRSWVLKRRSSTENIHRLFWNLKLNSHVHTSPPLVHVLSQINAVYTSWPLSLWPTSHSILM